MKTNRQRLLASPTSALLRTSPHFSAISASFRDLRALAVNFFRFRTTSSPDTRSPASANPSTHTQTPYPLACPGIAVGDAGFDTCLSSIEQIEAELVRIGEEESRTLNEK